jgi:hypothetical protein
VLPRSEPVNLSKSLKRHRALHNGVNRPVIDHAVRRARVNPVWLEWPGHPVDRHAVSAPAKARTWAEAGAESWV